MKLIILIIIITSSIDCLSQQKSITYERDTIKLIPPIDAKLAAFEINGVTLAGSYLELLDAFKRVRKSQFRNGKKKIKTCITYMKRKGAKQDTVHVTNLIEKDLDMGHAYSFFCRKLNTGKIIVVSPDKIIQRSIIREKSTYQGGMQTSWGASQYYLLNSKVHFIKINDWRS